MTRNRTDQPGRKKPPDATDMTIPLRTLLPDPDVVHRRLVDLAREQAILRRLLRLSMAARDERNRQRREAESYGESEGGHRDP